jgi:phosphatidate phosphatase APP1
MGPPDRDGRQIADDETRSGRMMKSGIVARIFGEVDAIVDWARDRVRGERGQGPFRIVPYRGHGTGERLRIRGRILEGRPLPAASAQDSAWRNFLHTIRRIESDEVPVAKIRARAGGSIVDVLADDEGYFDVELEPATGKHTQEIWRPVELELLDPRDSANTPVHAVGRVMVPPSTARFGIISDIDDTVVKTDVANLLSMLRLVLLTNAHTRLPFEGVAAFYRALHGGRGGRDVNPVFYVSSSPWNFYDLLDEVMVVHGIPVGPLFLKDYGISRDLLLSVGHREHKLAAIREILEAHVDLPFVLIGDSGQKDPEIYREVVRAYPGRVLVIYIRDVTSTARERELQAITRELEAEGVEMVLVQDTVAAAEHARRRGLIDEDAVPAVRGEKQREEREPGPIESAVRPR